MSLLLKNIIRFFLFIFVQVFVLNKIPPIHQFIVPYIYFLFILWLPFSVARFYLMLIAFFYGLALDLLVGTPGIHAAPCVLIAFLRPYLLNILLPQETTELSYLEPGINSMGWAPYAVYVLFLTFFHHSYLVLIEWLEFGNFSYFFGKVTATTAISLLMIFLLELFFYRKGKYRTNKAY